MPADATIVVLGAGVVGRAAVRYATASSAVGHLIVADRDLAVARRALEMAGGRGEAVSIDVAEAGALRGLLERGDAVLNCVGPFYRFGPPVLAAAIAVGTPYLDICDDWEPTLDMLGQDAAARECGLTAVIGQGASPGNANLLAAAAMAAIPDAKTLITGWSLEDEAGDAASAANEHWLHQATGTIRFLDGGRLVDEPPLAEVEVRFPGLPPRPAHTIGHPEAVTLPRAYPDLTRCVNVMTLPKALLGTLRRAATAVDRDGLPIRDAALKVLAEHRPGAPDEWPVYPGVWAIAQGATGTAGAQLTGYGSMTDMATVTAAPLVAGLELVLAGEVSRSGVLTPEQAFAPEPYFAALARMAGVDGPLLHVVRA